MGDTMVLVTACHAASPREGIDFLPLTVDYREYTYASGRIPGGFFKREGKPTEKEVLTSRLIDRPIRPLFPAGWRYETQIIAFVLSADTENDSDVLAITGASAALALSEMPFEKTIAGVRVGLVDGQYVINPTFAERKQSTLDLIVAGTQGRHRDGRSRREGGHRGGGRRRARSGARRDQADRRRDRRARRTRSARRSSRSTAKEIDHGVPRERRGQGARPARRGDAHQATSSRTTPGRQGAGRPAGVAARGRRAAARTTPRASSTTCRRRCCATRSSNKGVRLDGRKFDEIRPIWTETSVLPRVHGSVVFTRGETQALVTCTLGTADDQQKIEKVDGET